jgi:hypothetical protein
MNAEMLELRQELVYIISTLETMEGLQAVKRYSNAFRKAEIDMLNSTQSEADSDKESSGVTIEVEIDGVIVKATLSGIAPHEKTIGAIVDGKRFVLDFAEVVSRNNELSSTFTEQPEIFSVNQLFVALMHCSEKQNATKRGGREFYLMLRKFGEVILADEHTRENEKTKVRVALYKVRARFNLLPSLGAIQVGRKTITDESLACLSDKRLTSSLEELIWRCTSNIYKELRINKSQAEAEFVEVCEVLLERIEQTLGKQDISYIREIIIQRLHYIPSIIDLELGVTIALNSLLYPESTSSYWSENEDDIRLLYPVQNWRSRRGRDFYVLLTDYEYHGDFYSD